MRKAIKDETSTYRSPSRVLARVLSEGLRHTYGGGAGSGSVTMTTLTETDLGERFDFTFKGGDGDAF
jgi:hypothetical protein